MLRASARDEAGLDGRSGRYVLTKVSVAPNEAVGLNRAEPAARMTGADNADITAEVALSRPIAMR